MAAFTLITDRKVGFFVTSAGSALQNQKLVLTPCLKTVTDEVRYWVMVSFNM